MLARLGHDAFVSRNDEEHQVDAGRTREHVFDKAFMSGDIDKTKSNRADIELGKTYIDRYSALFFLRQTVRVDTG